MTQQKQTQTQTPPAPAAREDRAPSPITRAARLHPYVGPGWILRSLRRDPPRGRARPMVEHLARSLPALEVRLRMRTISAIAERLAAELGPELPAFPALAGALTRSADASLGAIERAQSALAEIVVAHQAAASPDEQRAVLIEHLKQRGAGAVDATRDVVATGRWLDLEAVQERFAAEIADRIDELEVAYRALAGHAQELDRTPDLVDALLEARVLAVALDHASPGRPPAARVAALKAASAILAALAPADRPSLVGASHVRAIIAWSNGASASRWIQVAAMELRALLFPAETPQVLAERLVDRAGPDGMILRRSALTLLAARLDDERALSIALLARDDPSEHVRQELARVLAGAHVPGALDALVSLAASDPSPRVRGVAVRELGRRASDDSEARPRAIKTLTALLAEPFSPDKNAANPPSAHPLVARVALLAIRSLATGSSAPCPPDVFLEPLAALVARSDLPPAILDDAAATLQLLEVEAAPVLATLRRDLEDKLRRLNEGDRAVIRVPDGTEPRQIERALAAAARGDLSVSLRRAGRGRFVLTRGEPRAFRLWRFLHELRTPMPDKRKGFVHTRARVPAGEITIPPAAMAEVTPTRVPGERQLSAAIEGWGYFLPRVDDLLAACALAPEPLRLITPLGAVTVRPPASRSARLRARVRLTLDYVRYAEARQGSLDAAEDALRRRYAAMARDLGFVFSIDPIEIALGGEGAHAAARPELPTKYLAPLAPFAAPSWMEHVLAYLLSPAGNTPTHLAWVVWVIFGALLVRAAFQMHRIESARRRIPLTIGGWGTRGKSGCERLKAALFHALRYDVVVKTTGCEAMFIHAMRDMPAHEIFLYRPYDKATIWEQKATLHTAENLGAQVFLWECMALQPRFVDTLANEWMRDPITTLTNAYPDHEDIQGPSGEDVARVIGRFMPEGGRTFTTEEQMLPLLRDAARQKGAELVEVSPLEAELLPADLLARLPYNEHPRNVALILELAEALGVDREFALVEMADHVVPDLGVLKTYPAVIYRGRSLTFSNGMSANERAGFLSNWTRLGFDKHDKDADPAVDTVVVVNNRADRVARSRVFAKILVEDIGADHIVLINTNLGGMLQFIEEALELRLRGAAVTGEGGLDRALERLDAALLKIGIPSRPDALADGLARMLRALPISAEQVASILQNPDIETAIRERNGSLAPALERAMAPLKLDGHPDLRPEIILHAERLADRIAKRDAVRADVRAAFERGAPAEADEAFRRAYKPLFMARIRVLSNADATGDQVIDFIARELPPGSDARLMGAQNIKGTGLDFVYRWLSIDRVRASLARMKSDPTTRTRELSWMLGYSDFGLVDAREALSFIDEARRSPASGWTSHVALLDALSRRLNGLVREKEEKLTSTGQAGLAVQVLGHLEQLIDHLDSMRRTTDATRIMADLYARRIGHGRAALLMRAVVSRTKGGWLAKDVMSFLARLKRGPEAPRSIGGSSKTPALPQ